MKFSKKRYLGAVLLSIIISSASSSVANEDTSQGRLDDTGRAPSGLRRDGRPAEENSPWRKWEKVPVRPPSNSHRSSRSTGLPAEWLIRVYQKYVSPVDGASCTYYPSCSSYGRQAIRRNGLLLGIPMTAERVMRDHHPDNSERYPLLERNGNLYYQDPVGSNDFWWHTSP